MPKPPAKRRPPPSQTWRTFVRNHLAGTIAIDFLAVPTVHKLLDGVDCAR
jgi:hypothetical protein